MVKFTYIKLRFLVCNWLYSDKAKYLKYLSYMKNKSLGLLSTNSSVEMNTNKSLSATLQYRFDYFYQQNFLLNQHIILF